MKKLHFLALSAMMVVAGNLQAEVEYTDLTRDMFHHWTSPAADATIENDGWCEYVIGESTGMPYGNGNVDEFEYANLAEYSVLEVTATEGQPRFLMNRDEHEGQAPDHLIAIPNDADQTAAYHTVVANEDGTTTYVVDLAKINEKYGYVHLHSIKGANWANVTVTKMVLGKEAAEAAATIGEPQWGVDRHNFPEDMIALGVPVRFPEMVLPVALEECEVTVSASLYGVPQGNEPMPISEDDDVDPGMGVDGPVCLAEAVLHTASLEGGVATAYLFPEMMEVGNHYAIVLNAVTVTKDEEIVAELPEDAYLAYEFDVVAANPVITVGEPVWCLDGDDESGYVLAEDAAALGVGLMYPDFVLPEGVDPNAATYTVTASLYISGGIMPLDGDDDADVNEGGMEDDPDVDPEFGVDGDECIVESAEFVGSVVGGVLRFNLFPEVCAADMVYTAIVEKIVVTDGEQVIIEDETASRIEFTVVPVEAPEELEIEPTFNFGEESVTLNNHSAASVECAESLVVNFVNGPMIMNASYAIDKCLGANEDGVEQYESLASGFLSLSTVGYAEFEQPLVFISGQQYKLTVKAWDVPELFDEDWNLAEPIAVQEFVFNGAASVGVIGEPVWGIDRHELPEDMINLGVKVSFPELTLPFGYAVEDCNIVVAASLYSVPEEQGEDVALYSDDDDDIDPGFGVDGPELLAMDIFTADSEGGVVSAWLFAEQLEVGGHYAIMLNAVTVIDGEDVIAELPEDAYYAIEFTVVPVEDITSLNGINAENAKVIYNLNGQKANEAKGIVILNAKKVMVK